jgi:hypothetical protein
MRPPSLVSSPHSILPRSNSLSLPPLSLPRGALGFGDTDRRNLDPRGEPPPLSLPFLFILLSPTPRALPWPRTTPWPPRPGRAPRAASPGRAPGHAPRPPPPPAAPRAASPAAPSRAPARARAPAVACLGGPRAPRGSRALARAECSRTRDCSCAAFDFWFNSFFNFSLVDVLRRASSRGDSF